MAKRFLMVTADSTDELAVSRRLSLLEACGLRADEAPWIRLDAGPIPHLDMFMWDGVLFADPQMTPRTRASHLRQDEVNHSAMRLIEATMNAGRPFFALGTAFPLVGKILGKAWVCQPKETARETHLRKTPAGKLDRLLGSLHFRLRVRADYDATVPATQQELSVLAIGEDSPAQLLRFLDTGYFTSANLPLTLPEANSGIASLADLLSSFVDNYGGSDDAA